MKQLFKPGVTDPKTGIVHFQYREPIQILLVGGRGVGKTSLLASMKSTIDQSSLNGVFTAIGDTGYDLNRLKDDLESYLSINNTGNYSMKGIQKSPDIQVYEFELIAKEKRKYFHFQVKIIDLPGGWYTEVKERRDKVERLLKDSCASLICIDTPSLMEGDDKIFHLFNHPTRVAGWYNDNANIQTLKDLGHKVMFVFSRCEKYRKCKEEMKEKLLNTPSAYKGLINAMKDKNLPVCISYVHTLGGVVFKSFKQTEQGAQEQFENVGLYRPENCETPFLWALESVCSSLKKTIGMSNSHTWQKFRNWMGFDSNDLAETAIHHVLENLQKQMEGKVLWPIEKDN